MSSMCTADCRHPITGKDQQHDRAMRCQLTSNGISSIATVAIVTNGNAAVAAEVA